MSALMSRPARLLDWKSARSNPQEVCFARRVVDALRDAPARFIVERRDS